MLGITRLFDKKAVGENPKRALEIISVQVVIQAYSSPHGLAFGTRVDATSDFAA